MEQLQIHANIKKIWQVYVVLNNHITSNMLKCVQFAIGNKKV
jgi:hypothetical protein